VGKGGASLTVKGDYNIPNIAKKYNKFSNFLKFLESVPLYLINYRDKSLFMSLTDSPNNTLFPVRN
ncbi:MAG: hypothetical protein K5776_02090, partial [Lachnospiraceae bacterium]|nr:hypothetical protein [Lachnospiraceae bacterium]